MSMSQIFYEMWYKKDVGPNLTDKQKDDLMRKISNLTLQSPIWLDGEKNHIDEFPELKPFSNSGKISGLQLVAVMECCLRDLQNP